MIKESLKEEEKYEWEYQEVHHNEIVKSIQHGHSFFDGTYCTILTDKKIHATNDDRDCAKNNVGKKLITMEYVKVYNEEIK